MNMVATSGIVHSVSTPHSKPSIPRPGIVARMFKNQQIPDASDSCVPSLAGELHNLLSSSNILEDLPPGTGLPVVVLPSWPWGEFPGFLLSSFLKRLGYCVHPLEVHPLGLSLKSWRAVLTKRITSLAATEGSLILIAYGQGVVFAKDIACRFPDHIRQIINIGTPQTISILQRRSSHDPLLPLWNKMDTATTLHEMEQHFGSSSPVESKFILSVMDHPAEYGTLQLEPNQVSVIQTQRKALLFSKEVFRMIAFKLHEVQELAD